MTTAFGNLRYFRQRFGEVFTECFSEKHYAERCGGRAWEDYYRRRWQYDKSVRTTHGCLCGHCCPIDVFVKDGVMVGEAPVLPSSHTGLSDDEPGGCARGLTATWDVYSPVRLRYPLVRDTLLRLWQTALREHADPVEAWTSIMDNAVKRTAYQQARGRGGLVRVSWEQALEMAAACLVHTVRRHGPDRIFGITPEPGKSLVSAASGARFFSLLGACMLSSADSNGSLTPAMQEMQGEPGSNSAKHWDKAGSIIVWGSNVLQSRSPDAHLLNRARYQGAHITAVSPDYVGSAARADEWLYVRPGTDGALALAISHVLLKEYYIDRPTPYFLEYAKRYTDLPCLVLLEEKEGRIFAGRMLRAADVGREGGNPLWKTVVFDLQRNSFAVPDGCVGSRHGGQGHGQLLLRDCDDGLELDPLLSLESLSEVTWQEVTFPDFSGFKAQNRQGVVPGLSLTTADGSKMLCTTVFDLLAASLSVERGEGGHYDDTAYATPAWQETLTGVAAADVVHVARAFADNAIATQGRSLIILGNGINHWYHSDSTGRCILHLTTLCACEGVQGGGISRAAGQASAATLPSWHTIARAADWVGHPRLQNSTSFFYFAMDAWRYELLDMHDLCPEGEKPLMPAHPADCNTIAARLGWLPSYPQFRDNPLDVCTQAEEEGAKNPDDIIRHVVKRLKTEDLPLALEAPSLSDNMPRVLFSWRTNPLGSSLRGHEYFLRHMLGADNAVLAEESPDQPLEFRHGPPDAPGKLDFMLVADFRMTATALYADMVLPVAHWFESHELACTDRAPFCQHCAPVADPLWEARDSWELFKGLAAHFSQLAERHLGMRKDLVTTPLLHNSPDEIAQPLGEVHDWRVDDAELVPGKTMPHMHVVERCYPEIFRMFTALGPLAVMPEELSVLSALPLHNASQVCSALLRLSPEATQTCTSQSIDADSQRLTPYATLSGRQHFYLDHQWMRSMGEGLAVYRQSLPLAALGEVPVAEGNENHVHDLLLHTLTLHGKWSINSTFGDCLPLRALSRGGGEIWINTEDAAKARIADNQWLQCFNVNGAFTGRAVVSPRVPPGYAFVPHAQQSHGNTAFSRISGQRGGVDNSLTRPLLKPTLMIGGYAQQSYTFNQYGPTACQRDTSIVVRKAGEVDI